jgi:hypothetical protein
MNPKKHKKDAKDKNMLVVDPRNLLESISYVKENIIYTTMQKDMNLSSLHPMEKNEITKLFHIKI